MESSSERIRISLKLVNPNPLFTTWIQEFIAAAEKKEAKSQFQLKKALSSLQKYPLPLHTGRDCIILEGFGHGICALLDKKLENYIKANMPSESANSIVELSESFRASEPYQREKEQEREEITKTVLENLVKDGRVVKGKSKPKKKKTESTFQSYEMLPGSYQIILLVDTQETIG